MPYSKRAHTLRTAVGNFPAARARLGSPSLVGFNINSPVPAGFVADLITQHSPARIQDGLRHLGFRDLAAIFAKVCQDFEATLVECSGEDDHVHLLVEYPPKVSLSKLVNSLKGVSSRRLRAFRPEIKGRYCKGVLWSASYFAASCGGAPLTIVRQYVENQRKGGASSPT